MYFWISWCTETRRWPRKSPRWTCCPGNATDPGRTLLLSSRKPCFVIAVLTRICTCIKFSVPIGNYCDSFQLLQKIFRFLILTILLLCWNESPSAKILAVDPKKIVAFLLPFVTDEKRLVATQPMMYFLSDSTSGWSPSSDPLRVSGGRKGGERGSAPF